MPRMNKLRLFNLEVKTAKFKDIVFDFQGKNTYIHAGNATCKSTTIGFMLNTLSPYKKHFTKGDSRARRYLKQYVQKNRPGAIIIEWLKDVQIDKPIKYLMTGQLVIMKNNKLRQKFFIKEYEKENEVSIDTFPFTTDEVYNPFNTIIQKLRLNGFKIIENYSEWTSELEKHYIDNGLIKRLVVMNETENSTKEEIKFQNKRGFINYIIEAIIPKPSHAEELIDSLRREYTLFNEIPRYEKIINYLKEVKELMNNNIELPEEYNKLSLKLEELLNTWNLISMSCTKIENSLSKLRKENDNQLTISEKQLSETTKRVKELTHEFKIVSLQYFKKRYSYYVSRIQKIKKEKKGEDDLYEFFNLYSHFRESEELKQRIEDLDEKKRLELGPLNEKLELLENEYREILIHSYQFTLYEKEKVKQKRDRSKSKSKELFKQLSDLKAEVKFKIKERNKIKAEVASIKQKIENFLLTIKPKLDLPDAIIYIEEKIKKKKVSIQKNIDKINLLKQEIERLKVEIRTSNASKKDLTREVQEKERLIKTIKLKWENLIKLEGFIQEYGSLSKNEPAYHLLYKQNRLKIEEKIERLTQDQTRFKQEIRLIEPKIEYYKEKNSFPTSKEVEVLIESLNKEGVVTQRGWEYYNENRSVIKPEWISEYSYLFEGIVAQDFPIEKIEKCLDDFDLYTEYPIYITHSDLFLKELSISEIKRQSIFIEKSVIWKFDPSHKEAFFLTLKQKLEELKADIRSNQNKKDILKKLREKTQEFLQFADKDKYFYYKEIISDGNQSIEELNQKIKANEVRKTQIENQEKNLTQKNKDIEKILSQWHDKEKKTRELRPKYHSLPKYKREVDQLTEEIPINKGSIRELEDDLIPESETEQEKLDKLFYEKKHKIEQLIKEFKENFTDKLEKKEDSGSPNKLVAEARNRYKSFKETIDNDPTINELEQLIGEKREARNRKESHIDNRCDSRNIIRDKIDFLWNQYSKTPDKIESLSELNRKRIDELVRQDQRFNGQKKKANAKIKELGKEIREDVKESPLTIKELKYKQEELENTLNQSGILEESVSTKIQNLTEKRKKIQELQKNQERIAKNIRSNVSFFVKLYEELKDQYTPADLSPFTFNEKSLKAIESLMNELETKENLLDIKREEIIDLDKNYNQKCSAFRSDKQNLVKKAKTDSFLEDHDVVTLLPDLKITQIPTMIEECDNDIQQREQELEEGKRKLKTQVDLLQGELVKCFTRIKQFQQTKITIQSKKAFTGLKPIEVQYKFNMGDVPELIHSFLHNVLTGFHEEKEFPEDWMEYHSLMKSLMSQFLEDKIREVKFLLPHGVEPVYTSFEQFMHSSGGQTATIAIILYCYIAHYKIKYKRKMHLQDYELVEKIPLSFPYISDNPIGNANLEELVRLQLDVAKSLNIQMIYFSGINELANIEEFETVIPVRKSSSSTVYIPVKDQFVITKGPTIHHTPIREE